MFNMLLLYGIVFLFLVRYFKELKIGILREIEMCMFMVVFFIVVKR